MTQRSLARLRKLEARASRKERLIVIDGGSDADFRAQIDAMKARGEATDADLIVCVRLFA
jgi:hypothetical protein